MKRSLLSLAVQGTITPPQPMYTGLLAAPASPTFGAVYRFPADAVERTVSRLPDVPGFLEEGDPDGRPRLITRDAVYVLAEGKP